MLGKLFKHEMKATARMFVPLYAIFFALALFTKGIAELNKVLENMLGSLSFFSVALFVIAALGMLIITLIVMVVRFYRNLAKDEGYLSHTLPVTPWQHVLTKLFAGVIWQIASITALLCGLIIALYNPNIWADIKMYYDNVQIFFTQMPLAMLVAMLILSLVSYLLMFFAAVSLGQISARHKLGMSFLMWLILYVISQIFSSIITLPIVLLNIDNLDTMVSSMLWLSLGLQLIMAIAYFTTASVALKRKLNLE